MYHVLSIWTPNETVPASSDTLLPHPHSSPSFLTLSPPSSPPPSSPTHQYLYFPPQADQKSYLVDCNESTGLQLQIDTAEGPRTIPISGQHVITTADGQQFLAGTLQVLEGQILLIWSVEKVLLFRAGNSQFIFSSSIYHLNYTSNQHTGGELPVYIIHSPRRCISFIYYT